MKVISKTISRNEFISRRNGVIPSLVDEWKIPKMYVNCGDEYPQEYVFNSYESAVAKINELGLSSSLLEYSGKFVGKDKMPQGHNYGLVVSDVIIPSDIAANITDYTDVYVNIPIPDNNEEYYDLNDSSSYVHYDGRKIISGDTEIKILTYTTLNKWYSFFREYKNLLQPYEDEETGEIKYKYSSATEYYNAEYEPKSEINKKEFEDLDALFKSRGGESMYEWILVYCMPHDKDKTPYKDVEPVDDVSAYTINAASYTIPILITTSIDDLGQMSIFSSKWKAGADYSNTWPTDLDLPHSYHDGEIYGTVVDRPYVEDETTHKFSTLNETFMIKGNSKGYYQNKYLENQFANTEYDNYTNYYISHNSNEFKTDGVTGYAYSPVNGSVIHLREDSEKVEKETIKYNKEDFFLINGEYVNVIEGYYVKPNISDGYVSNIDLKRGMMLPVYVDGALKYAELNGKKFYALKDTEHNKEYIYFTDISRYHDNGSEVEYNRYILYNNKLYLLNSNSTVLIEDENGNKTTYHVLNGYFIYKGTTYYVSDDSIVVPKLNVTFIDIPAPEEHKKIASYDFVNLSEDDLNYLGWESVSANVDTTEVTISHKLDIKRADMVTGYSDSKLDLLRRKKVNTDELGNELPGYLNLEKSEDEEKYANPFTHYNTPFDQCTLDILYEVGEVTNLEYQKEIEDEYGQTKINLYNGNYLESIKFYYKDREDEFVYVEGNDTREYLRLFFDEPDYDEYGNIIKTPLYNSKGYLIKIDGVNAWKGQFYRPGELVYCDITYYINATLESAEDENNNKIYVFSKKRGIENVYRHQGVKYVNTSVVTKSVGDFYMSDGSKFTFNYYQLKCEMTSENLDDFRDVQLTNMDYFEMKILTDYDGYYPFIWEDNGKGLWDNKEAYWERYNGMMSAPVFRTEYDLWSSTPQNLKSDIYIDRGINAAFEKHLKLEEVHTIEALENYSNGYFKINEY